MFYNIYVIKGFLFMFIVMVGKVVIYVVLYLLIMDVFYFVVKGDGSY